MIENNGEVGYEGEEREHWMVIYFEETIWKANFYVWFLYNMLSMENI